MQNDVTLKERLIFRRNALNLTQVELAHRSGLSERSISDYERGLSQPSLDQLRKLAKTLGVRSSYLLGEETIIESGQLREESKSDVTGYSSLDTDTLMKILADLAPKLRKFSPFERKHVLGNLRSILDVLEQRELTGDQVAEEMTRRGIAAGDNSAVSSKKSASDEIAEAVEDAAKPRRQRATK